MLLLQDMPTLTDLHSLINHVGDYPIDVQTLIQIAGDKGYPEAVVDFYQSFPEDEVFEDAEDLWARTEQIEMLHHENAPPEQFYDEE